MKYEQPTFSGRKKQKPAEPSLRYEDIVGAFATTSGAPTWTPKSLRQAIAIDAAATTLYLYSEGQWIAFVSA